jgi:hypothetical protein
VRASWILVGVSAFVGAAIAGLPPVRDGFDHAYERARAAQRRPRWPDVVRGVRWFEDDRRLAARLDPAGVERVVRARVLSLRPREKRVYSEAARRDARRALRRPPATVTPGPWPHTGPIELPIPRH